MHDLVKGEIEEKILQIKREISDEDEVIKNAYRRADERTQIKAVQQRRLKEYEELLDILNK
jgi:hypothetical protein